MWAPFFALLSVLGVLSMVGLAFALQVTRYLSGRIQGNSPCAASSVAVLPSIAAACGLSLAQRRAVVAVCARVALTAAVGAAASGCSTADFALSCTPWPSPLDPTRCGELRRKGAV